MLTHDMAAATTAMCVLTTFLSTVVADYYLHIIVYRVINIDVCKCVCVCIYMGKFIYFLSNNII